ncbi:MAG: glutaredoxin 3 [Gammaproteobacteria bacterium]|nr:MAG: glutaredoxin 3 [Gammaproteobacteria bacterium]
MARVLMYSTHICPYCRMAERLLAKKGVEPERVMVDDNPARREEMTRLTGRTSVPQIFVGTHHVGGYTELAELDRDGKLDTLLAQA